MTWLMHVVSGTVARKVRYVYGLDEFLVELLEGNFAYWKRSECKECTEQAMKR